MAKAGSDFTPEQMVAIATATKCLSNNIASSLDEMEKVFAQAQDDSVIGEGSKYREEIDNAISIVRASMKTAMQQLTELNKRVEQVTESFALALNVNINKNQEAVQVISAAAKKAKEAGNR